MDFKNILLIVGSLRERSLNAQLAMYAAQVLRERANVSFLEFADVPPMSQDVEERLPRAVERVRNEVAAADALWIVTPEYNHSIPGVLKNLLDWLSRPAGPAGVPVTYGKPVTYSGAAGSSGARYAFAALWTVLEFMQMDVVDVMPTGVALDRRAYETDVLELGERDRESIHLQANLLLMHAGVDATGACKESHAA